MQRMMKQTGGFRPRLQIVEMEGHGRYFEVYEEGKYAATFDHDGTLVGDAPPYRVEGETFASVYGGRVAEVYGFRAYEAACAEEMRRDPEGYDLSEVMPTPVLARVREEATTMGQSPIEVREKAEARERFHNKLRAFLAAGWELIEAWDDDGFNADVEYPLPAKITPPMSLDEWFSELSAHYETNEQARAEMAQADLDLSSEEDEVHDRIIAPPDNTAYRVVLSDEARADAERGPRATAKARRADCPDHRIDPMDNNWCRLCDTGECPDCSEPTYYDEAEGWYRHFDPTAGCFLIPPHAAE